MHRGLGKVLAVWGLLLTCAPTFGQEIQIEGGFVQDSLGIGEEVQFWLRASYPTNLELLLPDSNYNFSPFELVAREFVPTEIRSGLAFDSAAYTVQSFEIDAVQYLKLDALVLSGADSVVITSNLDSIYFKELAPVVTDSTVLKTNLSYIDVARQFNYPLLWIIIVVVFIVVVAVLLIFGPRIRQALLLRRLRKDYESFSEAITQFIRELQDQPEPELAEQALSTWKTYMERLEKRPYKKLTTKEILENNNNAELRDTLKVIDRTVYGKITQLEIFKKFQDIEDFTQHRYSMVVDKVKDGQTEVVPKAQKEVGAGDKKAMWFKPAKEEAVIEKPEVTQFGLSRDELERELQLGGRFVIFQYTISIIVMTFRRSSKVKFLKHDENAFTQGFVYTLITVLFGWWGIPWGPLFSLRSLQVNLTGGKDVTQELLNRAKN